MKLKGKFHVEHYGVDGKLIDKFDLSNGLTNQGFNLILDVMFYVSQAKLSAWAIGLINNAGFTGVSAADTLASHAGWVEYSSYSNYAGLYRGGWTAGPAASKQIQNAVSVDFVITADAAIKGIFLTSDINAGGVAGKLWCTGVFPTAKDVLIGQVFKVIYTLSVS